MGGHDQAYTTRAGTEEMALEYVEKNKENRRLTLTLRSCLQTLSQRIKEESFTSLIVKISSFRQRLISSKRSIQLYTCGKIKARKAYDYRENYERLFEAVRKYFKKT